MRMSNALQARISHRFPAADVAKRTVARRTPDGPLNVVKLRRRGPLVRAARHNVFATSSRRKTVKYAGCASRWPQAHSFALAGGISI